MSPDGRRFLLAEYFDRPQTLSNDDVEARAGGFTFVDCDCSYHDNCSCHTNLSTTLQPLIVACDGGCRYVGNVNAFAAIGVFVGAGSSFNVSELMPQDSSKPTPQRAELFAALRALQTAMRIKDHGWIPAVKTVVLKTDNLNLVNAMTNLIHRWRQNGYMSDRNGCPVADRELYWQLEKAVTGLHHQHGVETLFWWVPRKDNTAADKLARAPLAAEDNRRKALLAAKETDLHAKRKRGSPESADEDTAKRIRLHQRPVLPLPTRPNQYFQAPNSIQQPPMMMPPPAAPVQYVQAQAWVASPPMPIPPPMLAPQPTYRYTLPSIPALAPLPALPPPTTHIQYPQLPMLAPQPAYRYTLPTIPALAPLPPPPLPVLTTASPYSTYSPATLAAPVVTYSAPVQFGHATPLQTATKFFHNIAQFFGWR
ncbi:hypothetical protein LTR36_002294 [Oleoguttula mirabilis]|uniref:ribonuclease H n=1 Tax=Oleoguttula mirabilis TaxID=1507867 RepID=A0AAV9JKZ0_9PEZI|nr:hypothetical protein LTR36_002294 [Oleoguttula mirabilis]